MADLRLVRRMLQMLLQRSYSRITDLLNRYVFKAVVQYTINPFVILATILLIIPLILFSNATNLVLLGNTYLNVCSASVASIVLMQSLAHHHENKKMHAQHAKEIASLHTKIDALTNAATMPNPTPAPLVVPPTPRPAPMIVTSNSSGNGTVAPVRSPHKRNSSNTRNLASTQKESKNP